MKEEVRSQPEVQSPKSFAQQVRDLSAQYGVYDVPQMARLMSMPVESAQKMLMPPSTKRAGRGREPSLWFQKMFLELYEQKLEEFTHAA